MIWKLQGNTLSIQTGVALFQGTFDGAEIRGDRTMRKDDGTQTKDAFRMERPKVETHALRSAGSVMR